MPKKQRRHARDADHRVWSKAVTRYRESERAYRPIRSVFERVEHIYFSVRGERAPVSDADDAVLRRQMQFDEISADEGRFLSEWCAAARQVLSTRAPNLAAIIWKLELVRTIDWDEDIDWLILADLKRLQAHRQDEWRP